LRLARDGVSVREIAQVLGVVRSTVHENLSRAAKAGLAWPLPGELTDEVLEHRRFAHAGVKQCYRRRPQPHWAHPACQLKKPGVNLTVLFDEYRAVHLEG